MEGISVVLSGMSTEEQMKDNLSFMKNFESLNEKELEVIDKAQQIINDIDSIPCTACRYCMKNCPKKIRIPSIFEAMNFHLIYGLTDGAKKDYQNAIKDRAKASECLACGACEKACPQHIRIIDKLKECASVLED